jgi:phospholipid transport system substrate-binding protein
MKSADKEVCMAPTYRWQLIVFSLLVTVIAVPSQAGEPTEKIKQTTDKIIAIVTDPALKTRERKKDRKRLIRNAVDERFDWEEMSRRTLARHWTKRTGEERKEFMNLFGKLIERTYMDKVDDYSGEKVHFEGETVDGEYGTVNVRIITKKETEIRVLYRVKKKGVDWYVYDISIEGVSFINNYRTQFNSIIVRSSYENLVKRLKAKVE